MIYQKKPEYVDAFLLTPANTNDALDFLRKRGVEVDPGTFDFPGIIPIYIAVKEGTLQTYDKEKFEENWKQL